MVVQKWITESDVGRYMPVLFFLQMSIFFRVTSCKDYIFLSSNLKIKDDKLVSIWSYYPLLYFSARETRKRDEDQTDEGTTTGWSEGKGFTCIIDLCPCPLLRKAYTFCFVCYDASETWLLVNHWMLLISLNKALRLIYHFGFLNSHYYACSINAKSAWRIYHDHSLLLLWVW